MPVTNDEHTCSLISLVVYSYLDPVIFLGAKVSHLKFDQLPPLMDTDYSKNLVKRAFPVRIFAWILYPANQRFSAS
jgi:hypothetical protein